MGIIGGPSVPEPTRLHGPTPLTPRQGWVRWALLEHPGPVILALLLVLAAVCAATLTVAIWAAEAIGGAVFGG
jgi:hypothetical protein